MANPSLGQLSKKMEALNGAGVMAQAAAASDIARLVLETLTDQEARLCALEKGATDETSG